MKLSVVIYYVFLDFVIDMEFDLKNCFDFFNIDLFFIFDY